MNNLDKQYTALLQDILDNGVTKQDRTGTGTISVFGRQIRHKMSEGFPLLTTKKMAWKSIVTELLWFLRGDTNIKFLVDNDCHIWDGDCYQSYLENWKPQPIIETQPYLIEQEYVNDRPLPKDMFIHCIKTDDEFANEWGDLGPIYGKQWRGWNNYFWEHGGDYPYGEGGNHLMNPPIDQIANSINLLKTDPDSRRNRVNAWNVGELDQMVLPPCHTDFQFFTRELSLEERLVLLKLENIENILQELPSEDVKGSKEYLDFCKDRCDSKNIPTRAISLMWNQRSVDTFLGLPFNIASYGLLLEIIAKEVNMVPDELIGNLGDTHLYLNHIEQAKEQIGREYTHKERKRMLEDAMTEDIYNEAVANLMPFGGGMSEYYDAYKIPTHTREPYPLPKLDIKLHFRNEPSFVPENWLVNDFVIENYKSHSQIKAPLSN